MELKEFVQKLSETAGVSGYEMETAEVVKKYFDSFTDEIHMDEFGNLLCLKKGTGNGNKKIMLAAHMDEIGLMVKEIDDKGFIKFTNIGGIDQRTLLCQEVIIHGKEKVYGVIGVKPPHLTTEQERSKAYKMEDLVIDVGLSKEKVDELIRVGDIITFKRSLTFLLNDWVAGKSLDDRAGVAALYICLKELQSLKHDIDVYCVATVQEEVGTRGAIVSTYEINPDLGIAIDVGFGKTPELNKFDTIEMAKGPGIAMGPNIHPKVFKKLKEVAKDNYIDYQIEVEPGVTGTDARSIQISREGIATGLLSIPLRYMHTSVETISLSDIEKTGKLLAKLIVSLNEVDMEEWLCY
ncbi:M42 family metallopeptidase [Clostridium formicaceticum]|uniref:Aminopeptidase n=1 Tax=Clostridium formicaceticum TaxID=1497 RepID=A0AAC9RLB6_9CLOT|nr:M42 family metallopeptidase [Clostridium formicaceticum]AOY77239.1 aminopeptidase [Clostridium formicaceticum]ARE87772.1 Putative aminopeptidase YsdC [Clostridium formicaceticum]